MPGIKGRSGRKSKAEEMQLSALLDACWTPLDREVCIKKLAKLANEGEMEAVKLLMSYTFGKPRESVQHSSDPDAPVKLVVEYVNDWRKV